MDPKLRKAQAKASLEHNRAENFMVRNQALIYRNSFLERRNAELEDDNKQLRRQIGDLEWKVRGLSKP